MNVMVMAGTKDASKIIKMLSKVDGVNILATTTTVYGGDIARRAGAHEVISKALNMKEMVALINKKDIELLIDATHPFATEATRNAINSSKIAEIKYLRFERPLMHIPENDLLFKVTSFEEAASKALELTENLDGKILHLGGVSTLKFIVDKINKDRIVVRVLPSVDSIKKCIYMGLSQENIIAMQGTFKKEFNKALMKEYEISLVITKESGETGGTPSKIEAALELGVMVVLVIRPEVSELKSKKVYNSLKGLYNEIGLNLKIS